MPTLPVVGEREQTFVPLRAYAEATIPELRVVATPAGHAQAAAAFDAAVTSFVTSLPS